MAEECKYRLPCNWCDKYDRECDVVLWEIKENQYKELLERYAETSLTETNKAASATSGVSGNTLTLWG